MVRERLINYRSFKLPIEICRLIQWYNNELEIKDWHNNIVSVPNTATILCEQFCRQVILPFLSVKGLTVEQATGVKGVRLNDKFEFEFDEEFKRQILNIKQ